MLLAIREHAKGWIAWVVIILIGAAFALFGLSNYMGPSGGSRAVATVNGNEISPEAVSEAYRNQRQQIEQALGDRFDPGMIDDQALRRQALDQVIDQHLMTEFVQSKGLRLSDQDLAAVIRSQEMFQEDGRFSSDRYHQLLRANGLSSPQYEAQIRRMRLLEQLQGAIGETSVVTDRDVEQVIALQQQERDVSYLTVPLAMFRQVVSVDDAAVRSYYEEHQDEFTSPERVKLNWVELRQDDLLADMDISEEELRARYDQVRERRFTDPETRDVRHLLVQLPEDADGEAEEAARRRTEELRARIEGGEDFSDVAREASDDTGSASRGGELGEVARGDMVETFEERAFSLEPGELSEPVRTRFGYHLIQVDQVRGGATRSFEDVQDELREELAMERVSNAFFDAANRLDQLAFDWPDTLQEAADALDLEIRTTDWIARDGTSEGVGSHEEVIEAAFSEPVLQARQNSDLLELEEDRYVVIRVDEHQAPEQLAMEDVEEEIRERIRNERAVEAAQARVQALEEQLREGASLETVTGDTDEITLSQPGYVSRESDVPAAVLQEAFGLERPGEEGRSVGQVRLDGDNYAVVVVSGVRDGDMQSVDDEERQRIRDQLRIAYGQDAMRGFVEDLRARAEVEVFEERL